ncbi:MAG: PLP-dependent transferase [Acidobacteria bacterium]|nr:PLP-dependent transferase [Acidobacteriota bacterium]
MPLRPGLKASTIAVHAGSRLDPSTGSPTPPVYRTSAFAFESIDEMIETFAGRKQRFIYSRYSNPTVVEAEERLAALEGAEGAVAFSSGMAAITASLMSVVSAGDHVVVQRDLYGGTTRLLERVFTRMGVELTIVGTEELESPGDHRRPNSKALFCESPTNPTLRVLDLDATCRRAREAGLIVIADNTFATPIHQNPLAAGASFSIHSATKYLAGHGDLIAGIVAANGEHLARLRDLRIELGGSLDPDAGWVLARSLKTLPLRVRAQSANAMAIAARLESHAAVARVHYPGLPSHPRHAVARRQMRGGFGGMLSFELKGGEGAARRFVEGLSLVRLLPTLGGIETSVSLPAFSSHFSLSPEARAAAGVTDGLVRLSLGIEETSDLVEEIDRALANV